jgi:outer membrane protein assembly factor BamB
LHIYVSDDKGAVHALSRQSGTSVWRQDRLFRRTLTSPVVMGNKVAVGDVQGFLHVMENNNGAFAGRSPTDGSQILAPLIPAGDTLLAQTRNGNLVAFSIQ